MKRSHALLVATLGLNVLLALAWFFQPRPHPATAAASIPVAESPDPLLAALTSGDAAALRAAGVSDDVIRHLALGQAAHRLQNRLHAVKPQPPAETRYWKNLAWLRNPYTREQRAELNAAQNEFGDALRSLLGEELSLDPIRHSQRLFLPAAKQDQLARIEHDYAELHDDLNRETGPIRLASDLEKLKFLDAEKERDLATLLTSAEREQLDLRESPTALKVRAQFGEAFADENDYRQFFALQKSFDEKYARISPLSADRQTVQAELEQKIETALGPEKFAALVRLADQDRRQLSSLDRRLSLPPGTVDRTITSRDAYAQESQRLQTDPALSPAERENQIKQLATRARADLTTTLGATAAEAYAASATWLSYLKQGSAFSTDPKIAPPFISRLNFASFPLSVARASGVPSIVSPAPSRHP